MSWLKRLFGKTRGSPGETIDAMQGMSDHDEFICGRCGVTSQWGDRYYQSYTPDVPCSQLPVPTYGTWAFTEHYRAFCPRCGDMVAEAGTAGLAWSGGARPVVANKLPTQRGGNWIFEFAPFTSCLVARQDRAFNIEHFKQTSASERARQESRHRATISDLIDKLRASKGKMAGNIEGELSSRGAEAVPHLIEALKEPEVYLRWRTCYVLKAMGREAGDARDALVQALQDEAQSVRDGAQDALECIGFPSQTAAGPSATNAANPNKELLIAFGGSVTMEFVLVPAGSFMMGSDKHSALPTHKVTITKPFYIGKYAVTQEQWKAVMGSNPSYYGGERNPVDSVSWNECQTFIEKLNKEVPGHKFSLPSEAQWEYACRAGSMGEYCYGDDEGDVDQYAWHNRNSGYKTHAVGEKKANAWGLYDMHGNVIEWCQDICHWDYEGAPTDGSAWSGAGAVRVARGGSFSRYPSEVSSASRYSRPASDSNDDYGLRVVAEVNS